MPKFIEGQLVQCITAPYSHRLKVDSIHKVKKVHNKQGHEYILLEQSGPYYATEDILFHTVIRNINDVVKGMTLTYKNGICGIVDKIDSINETVTIKYNAQEKNINIRDFKAYIGPEVNNEKEYKVIKPFNIVDLYTSGNYNCYKFLSEYGKLLKSIHKIDNLSMIFRSMSQIEGYKILNDNLDYLEEKGYIEKVIKDVILISGMKLYNKEWHGKFKVINASSTNSGQYYFLHIHHNSDILSILTEDSIPLGIKYKTTLKQLNELMVEKGWPQDLWSISNS